MQWSTPTILALIAISASSVSMLMIFALQRRFAALAESCSSLLSMEGRLRSTVLVSAELAELSDAIGKGNALLKRINSRDVMRDRREAKSADGPPDDPAQLKAYLRRKAGLVAGQPAPHRE